MTMICLSRPGDYLVLVTSSTVVWLGELITSTSHHSTQAFKLVCRLQGPVEDGLVHVDIALPDYKLALFLENAHKHQGKEASSSGHSDGTTLNGCAFGWLLLVSRVNAILLMLFPVALTLCRMLLYIKKLLTRLCNPVWRESASIHNMLSCCYADALITCDPGNADTWQMRLQELSKPSCSCLSSWAGSATLSHGVKGEIVHALSTCHLPTSIACNCLHSISHGFVAAGTSSPQKLVLNCRGRTEEEKQKLLMQLMTKAGQMHTMQGRMNSMVHGTLRTVGDEKSRFQNASVGYHLKRDKQ